MTETSAPAPAARCRARIEWGSNKSRKCGRKATGPDGLCGHCRPAAPRPKLCRACGNPDMGDAVPSRCGIEHERGPGRIGYAD